MKIFTYKNCGTCKKASKFFKEQNMTVEEIPIRETPPSVNELERMLSYYDQEIKLLFNRSGKDYRELNIKEKIKTMSKKEALDLLSNNGNLIKRPFVLSDQWGLVGFDEERYKQLINHI